MYEIIGILLFIVPLMITTWWVLGEHPHKGWAFAICIVALLVGAFLILEEKATELTVKGVGTIKSAAEKAKVDANAIADLKTRIRGQTETIDRIVKDAAEAKQLLNDLNINNQVAKNHLSRLDSSIADANLAVRDLQLFAELNNTIFSANNDSRQAYARLRAWGENSSFRFQKEAVQAVQTIIEKHNPGSFRTGFDVLWNDDVDPQDLSIGELWQAFINTAPQVRLGILEFVWIERTDIPKRDRLQFLVDVFNNDDSLRVIEYAGRYFEQGTMDGFKPIEVASHLGWWKENQGSIE